MNIQHFSDEELKAEIERREQEDKSENQFDMRRLNLHLSGYIHYKKDRHMFDLIEGGGATGIHPDSMKELYVWLLKFFPAPQIDLSDIDWENIDNYSDYDAEDLGIANQINANDYLRDLRTIANRVRPKQME